MRAQGPNRKREGEQNAAGVFHRYSGYIRRLLRFFGVDERDLPDISQDVLIAVHRKLDQFQGHSDIKTWLYRICANTASDYRRRAHRKRERLMAGPPDRPSADDPHRRAVCSQQLERVASALATLNEEQRRVFVMYELQQRTMSDIAATEQCPLKTAFSRLYAARRHLVEQLASKDKSVLALLPFARTSWLDTPGIEQTLRPVQLRGGTAGAETLPSSCSGMLSPLLGKPSLASLGMTAMALCFMAVSPQPPVPTASPALGWPKAVKGFASVPPLANPPDRPAQTQSRPADVRLPVMPESASVAVGIPDAEAALSHAHTRMRFTLQRPSPKPRNPSGEADRAVSEKQVAAEPSDAEMIVYRAGEVDLTPRIPHPLSLPAHRPRFRLSHEKFRPAIVPPAPRLADVAKYTERQFANIRF